MGTQDEKRFFYYISENALPLPLPTDSSPFQATQPSCGHAAATPKTEEGGGGASVTDSGARQGFERVWESFGHYSTITYHLNPDCPRLGHRRRHVRLGFVLAAGKRACRICSRAAAGETRQQATYQPTPPEPSHVSPKPSLTALLAGRELVGRKGQAMQGGQAP